jgi:AcrR family transcriptional regulator
MLDYYSNMFKQEIARGKSKETRASILSHAIRLFRERGFDATTMRDVADAAGLALGSAYYYFPGKEAIVQAYYDEVQSQHLSRVTEALAAKKHNLEERLRIAFHAKFDILADDRKLLGALFRYTADPSHPLSVFGPANQITRQQSMSVFGLAVGEEKLPDDIRATVPLVLWALHMGILLYFIYDESLGQERTRKLIDGAVRIIVRILSVARLPIMKPLRGSLISLLREIELFPEPGIHIVSMHEER